MFKYPHAAEELSNTSGDSSDKMIAPRVSTWITFANGKEGVFDDIQTKGLQLDRELGCPQSLYQMKVQT
jgi:hypothetical protein